MAHVPDTQQTFSLDQKSKVRKHLTTMCQGGPRPPPCVASAGTGLPSSVKSSRKIAQKTHQIDLFTNDFEFVQINLAYFHCPTTDCGSKLIVQKKL